MIEIDSEKEYNRESLGFGLGLVLKFNAPPPPTFDEIGERVLGKKKR